MGVWVEWCAVRVTATVNMTAPISKKQKQVGIKYLAKILWESSLVLLVQCSLAFSLYDTWACQDRVQGSKERKGSVTNTIAHLKDITHLPRNS